LTDRYVKGVEGDEGKIKFAEEQFAAFTKEVTAKLKQIIYENYVKKGKL
jgi:hypothetical protein